jgi:DNA-binding beta-propeller fold protein YncE
VKVLASFFSSGIAIDPNRRNIFVVDTSNHRVQKFTPNFDPDPIKIWGFRGTGDGQFSFPQGIAIDSDGDVYVVDFGNHRIQKFDRNGVFIKSWGSPGTGDGQFNEPVGITFNRLSGNLFVSDFENRNIQVFTTDGVFRGKVLFGIISDQ